MFRFTENADGSLEVFAGGEHAVITTPEMDVIKINSTNANFFVNYFDLSRNYDMIIASLGGVSQLKQALAYSHGVRLLAQDLLEVIVGFIISANNNISRIRRSMKFICEGLGKPVSFGYAFPTLKELSVADVEFFTKAGLGYRAAYMADTIKRLSETDMLIRLNALATLEAKRELMTLSGVGPKVADCILVFGLGRREMFPVDTWIEKMYYKFFSTELRSRTQIASFLAEKFKENSAYAQQYLYYFTRETKIKV